METSFFAQYRQAFHPQIPRSLENLLSLKVVQDRRERLEEGIADFFRCHDTDWILRLEPDDAQFSSLPLRIGVVLSGGPAPGGHNVIVGLYDAIKEVHPESRLFGFLGGPKGLLRNQVKEITSEQIDGVRNTGGFDLLGSGRSKIETEEEIQKAIETVESHFLDGLVFIGGDDSNTDAAFLAEGCRRSGRKTCVIGVPKTIDGDLQSADIPISFGFDTASKVYSEIIGNLAKDMVSTKKYYFFVRLMGRVASHITLECALKTHPNLALISEEIAARGLTLCDLVSEVADLVEERNLHEKRYGLVLVPEGLIEHIPDVRQLITELNDLFAPSCKYASTVQACMTSSDKYDAIAPLLSESSRACLALFPRAIAETLLHERDPHGNVQVSRVETERWLGALVEKELKKRNRSIPFSFQTAYCGYEGRSAYPSFFDCQYCYALGRLSAVLVARGLNGFMAGIRDLHMPVDQWQPVAVPFTALLHFERRSGTQKPVIRRTLVQVDGPLFRTFAEKRTAWRLDDTYQQPGPIQYWGPKEVVEAPCLSVMCIH
jgi:diphosphate-dependent phosphofructokinase